VVDAWSTDRTRELAQRLGAQVIVRDWPGYAQQKNFGIERASQPWVLSVDADEEVTPGLVKEIESRLMEDVAVAAYRLWRPTFFLGRPLSHYGREPQDPGQIRLFRKGQARFEDRLVHERLVVDGPVAVLHAPLHHYSYPTLKTYWAKIHRYAKLEAQELVRRGTMANHRWMRAVGKFFWMLFWRRGVLDGPRAWLWIAGQAYQEWLIGRESVRLTRKEQAHGTT
jgi:glycosyltransferase involved in cell wall biosynthesis